MTKDEAKIIVKALQKGAKNPAQLKKLTTLINGMVEGTDTPDDPTPKSVDTQPNEFANIRQSLKKCVTPARKVPLDKSTLSETRKTELSKGVKLRTEGESIIADNARRKRKNGG